MRKLKASLIKDVSLLFRDKVGLALMFVMPIVLAILIASLQNNTYKLVNDHQFPLAIIDQDNSEGVKEFVEALDRVGMFEIHLMEESDIKISEVLSSSDAMACMVVPQGFGQSMKVAAQEAASGALTALGVSEEAEAKLKETNKVKVFYKPVIAETYRYSIEKAIESALKIMESKKMISEIYKQLNGEPISKSEELLMNPGGFEIEVGTVGQAGITATPNASQHNVPAWTIFAMFFIVASLGSNLVREKTNGTIIRHKTMGSSFVYLIVSKQIVYLLVALLQVLVIFSIGSFLFPYMGLPALSIPSFGIFTACFYNLWFGCSKFCFVHRGLFKHIRTSQWSWSSFSSNTRGHRRHFSTCICNAAVFSKHNVNLTIALVFRSILRTVS